MNRVTFSAASVSRFFNLLAALLVLVGLGLAVVGWPLGVMLPALAILPTLGFILCMAAVPAMLLGSVTAPDRAVFL